MVKKRGRKAARRKSARPASKGLANSGLEIFATTPQSKDVGADEYLERVAEAAQWSEAYGYCGTLVYTDNGLVDPWQVSQAILERTSTLCPLVAVQPIYMHPYAVAKIITTYAYLFERRIYLNMLAGGFRNDLIALNDTTPHDDRYVRTVEYTQIIQALLRNEGPVTFEGKYYAVKNLRLTPPIPDALYPGILISGSSEAGMNAAKAIGATAIKYPQPASEEVNVTLDEDIGYGVRVGIIARQDDDDAWRVALERFPEDRRGQIAHGIAMKVSDSHWHRQISDLGDEPVSERNPYWLGPFKNYKTFCPYLVGSYARVTEEVARYVTKGYRTFILDIPPSEEELAHTNRVFEDALAMVGK